jgi:hypothetical protein
MSRNGCCPVDRSRIFSTRLLQGTYPLSLHIRASCLFRASLVLVVSAQNTTWRRTWTLSNYPRLQASVMAMLSWYWNGTRGWHGACTVGTARLNVAGSPGVDQSVNYDSHVAVLFGRVGFYIWCLRTSACPIRLATPDSGRIVTYRPLIVTSRVTLVGST